jgi:hypothetical protein
MSENAKSHLLEFLKDLGYSEKLAVFKTSPQPRSGVFHSTVNIVLPGDCEIYGAGEGHRRSDAESAVAQAVLDQLHSNYPDLFVDWTKIRVEAQAGDALIKLGAYLTLGCNSASSSSQLLQNTETNLHLAQIFGRWRSQGEPELAIWGPNLSKTKKATLVEALLWRRFSKRVLTSNATTELRVMIDSLV